MGHKVFYKLRVTSENERQSRFEVTDFIPNVTHVQVAEVGEEFTLDDIFNYFNWMGNGQEGNCPSAFSERVKATEDLHHSSMSVGDVVVQSNGKVVACDNIGWSELIRDNRTFKEIWRK